MYGADRMGWSDRPNQQGHYEDLRHSPFFFKKKDQKCEGQQTGPGSIHGIYTSFIVAAAAILLDIATRPLRVKI